uniref:MBD domain-containing protein n=1 Tax=Cacopsylla melanoneura TaxID=428564 RepID=A0A8D8PXS5_9HEMI
MVTHNEEAVSSIKQEDEQPPGNNDVSTNKETGVDHKETVNENDSEHVDESSESELTSQSVQQEHVDQSSESELMSQSVQQEVMNSDSISTSDKPTEVTQMNCIEFDNTPSDITPQIEADGVNATEIPSNSLPIDNSSVEENNASKAIEKGTDNDESSVKGNIVNNENIDSAVESNPEVESTETSIATDSIGEPSITVQSSVDTNKSTQSMVTSERMQVEDSTTSISETSEAPHLNAVEMSSETHGDVSEATSNQNVLGSTPADSTPKQMTETNVTSSSLKEYEPMETDAPVATSSSKETDNVQTTEKDLNIAEQTSVMETNQAEGEAVQEDSKKIKESDEDVKPTVNSNTNKELIKTNTTDQETSSENAITSDETFKDNTISTECVSEDKKESEPAGTVQDSITSSEGLKTTEETSITEAPVTSNKDAVEAPNASEAVETPNASEAVETPNAPEAVETSNTEGVETTTMEATEGVKEEPTTMEGAECVKEELNEGEAPFETSETPYLLVTGDNLNMLEIENLSKELCGTEFMVEMDTSQPPSEPSYRPNALAPAGTELPNLPPSQPILNPDETQPTATPASTPKKRASAKRSKSSASAKSDGGESGAAGSSGAPSGVAKTKAGRAKLRISMPNLKIGGGKKKSKVGGGAGTPAGKALGGATPKKGAATKLGKTKGATPTSKPKRAKSLGNTSSSGTPNRWKGKKTSNPDDVINNSNYKVPLLEFGWFRELVHRKGSTPQKRQGDIYYFSPEPERKKYRSRNEIERILPKDSPLTPEHFSFCKTLIGLGADYERERGAMNPGTGVSVAAPGKVLKRKSLATAAGTPGVKKSSPKKPSSSLLVSTPTSESSDAVTPSANKRVPRKSIKLIAMEETDKENEETEEQGSEETKKSKTAVGPKRKSLASGQSGETKAKSKTSSADTKESTTTTPRGRKSKGKLVEKEKEVEPEEEISEKRKTPKNNSSEKSSGKLKLKLTGGKLDKDRSTGSSVVGRGVVARDKIETKRDKVVLKEKNSSPTATSVSREERAKRNASIGVGRGATPSRDKSETTTTTGKKLLKSATKVDAKDSSTKSPKVGPASKTERTSVYAQAQADRKRRGSDVRPTSKGSETPTGGPQKSSAPEKTKNVGEKSADKSTRSSGKSNSRDNSEDRKVAPISLTITKSPQKTIVSIKKSTDGRKPGEIKVEIRKPSSASQNQSETKKNEDSRCKAVDTDSGSSDEVHDGKKSKSGFFESIKTRKRSGFTLSQEECDIISGAKKSKRSPHTSPLEKTPISPGVNISNEEAERLSSVKVMLSPCHKSSVSSSSSSKTDAKPTAVEATLNDTATSGRNKRSIVKTLEAEFDKIDQELLTGPPASKRKRLGVNYSAAKGSKSECPDDSKDTNGVGGSSSERKSSLGGNNKAVKCDSNSTKEKNGKRGGGEEKEGEGKRKSRGGEKKESVTMNGGQSRRLSSPGKPIARIHPLPSVQSGNKLGSLFTSEPVTKSNRIYPWLVHLLSYLTVQERLRMARVCKLFNLAAQDSSLWTHIRMKNSRVTDWSGCASSFHRHHAESLDMKKMILPSSSLAGSEATNGGVDPTPLMWIRLPSHLKGVQTLKTLDLGKCSSCVFENLKENLTQLVSLSATLHKGQPVVLSHFNAMANLVKLKLKGYEIKKGAQNIYGVDHLSRLSNLKHLALTSVGNLNSVTLDALTQSCPQLTALELGSCAKLTAKDGAKLTRLTSLQKLRLEILVTGASNAFLTQVSKMPQLSHLELINVDVTEGFDDILGECTSLRTFIIIPTYVSQSAVTNFLLLSGIAKLQTTLRLVSWGLTVELLKVTDMFAAKWKGPNQFKSDGTCVPVMSPIPSCYLSADEQPPSSQEVKKEVDLFPISKLRKLLTLHMKTNGVSIFTVSYSNTLRHTMMDRL